MTGFFFLQKTIHYTRYEKKCKNIFFTTETLNLKICKKKGKFTKIVFGKGAFCC